LLSFLAVLFVFPALLQVQLLLLFLPAADGESLFLSLPLQLYFLQKPIISFASMPPTLNLIALVTELFYKTISIVVWGNFYPSYAYMMPLCCNNYHALVFCNPHSTLYHLCHINILAKRDVFLCMRPCSVD
jgi:hypothetical protein